MLNPSKLEVVIIVTAIIFIILFNLILFKIARYLSSAATIHQKSIHTFFWFWVIIIGWLYFHLQATVMNNDKFILSQMDYYPGFQKIVLVLERRANNPSISSFHALIRAQHNKKIKYPSDEDIQLNSLTSRYNILWIVIDTLRYDAISPTLTPNIFEFQKHAINFTNHQSSGNSTQAGVFGMFYGLPPSYFPATIQHHQEPLLMKLLEKSNYDINIFYSGNLELPPWKLNLFSQRKKNQIHQHNSSDIGMDDHIATQELIEFLNHWSPKSRPFFSYYYLSSVHGYCSEQNYSLIYPQYKPSFRTP